MYVNYKIVISCGGRERSRRAGCSSGCLQGRAAQLNSLLAQMYQISIETTVVIPDEVEVLAAKCINFAAPRIKAYRSHLKTLLQRCLEHLDNQDHDRDKSAT